MAEPIIVKLLNVRLAYPKFYELDEKSKKYGCLVLIPKGSPAEAALMDGIKRAWAQGAETFGKASFPANPSNALLVRRAYLKVGGGCDFQGNDLPDWYEPYIGCNLKTRNKPVIVQSDLTPADPEDLFNGQIVDVSVLFMPLNKENNPCIGHYLRSVRVVGGGEPLNIGGNNTIDIQKEWE